MSDREPSIVVPTAPATTVDPGPLDNAPAPVSQMMALQIPRVEARRCGGRVCTVLGKAATAADPWFFTADDGTTYVVKVATRKNRMAFNEAVFGRLARHVELRVPELVTINIPPDLIADDPELSAVKYPPGDHVGVARLPNGSFDLRGGVLTTLGPNLQIENEAELPGTVVYSSWIDDADHAGNDGNWMLEPREDNKYVVWMIDFGHSLGGPNWTSAALAMKSAPTSVRKMGPHKIAEQACCKGFETPIAIISTVSREELEGLVQAIPADWQPDLQERTEVVNFLIARRSGVESLFKVNL